MNKKNLNFLLVKSHHTNKGGVASYYNALLPYLPKNIRILEIGRKNDTSNLFYPIIDQIRFHNFLKQEPFLVHINPSLAFRSFFRDAFSTWQAKKKKVPVLVFWHGWNWDFAEKVEKKYHWFFHRTFGQADAFIVLASEFEQCLRKWGVKQPIYRGTTCVDDRLLKSVSTEKKWKNFNKKGPINILFLSRLEQAKGVFETVQAVWPLLRKDYDIFLTIAGDGSVKAKLEALVKEIGLSRHVLFTGDIRGEEKANAFIRNHIYCLPTYGEGLPTSVLEAMAFGLPVVTRPVGGLNDIFIDGKMGKLVYSKSPEEIAVKIEELIRNPDEMVSIGKYNAEYAKKHFMASQVAKWLLDIYKRHS